VIGSAERLAVGHRGLAALGVLDDVVDVARAAVTPGPLAVPLGRGDQPTQRAVEAPTPGVAGADGVVDGVGEQAANPHP
jgi:hypothetical protein